jgi:hypothetical protein
VSSFETVAMVSAVMASTAKPEHGISNRVVNSNCFIA